MDVLFTGSALRKKELRLSLLFDIMTNLTPIILSPPIITLSKTAAKASTRPVVFNFEMGTGVGRGQELRIKHFSIRPD